MRNLLIITSIWSLTFCSQKDYNTKLLEPEIKQVEFPITPETPNNPHRIELKEINGEEKLYFFNHFSNKIQRYDIKSEKVDQEIIIESDGINKITSLSGFTVEDENNIWITSNPPELILINQNGEIERKLKVENAIIPITYINSFQAQPLILNNGSVFGAQPYFMDHHNMSREDIYKHQLVFEYTQEAEKINWHDIFYSENYWDNGKKVSNFSWAKREGKLYIAPWYDDEIIVYSLDSSKVEDRKLVKSGLVNKFKVVNNFPTKPNQGFIADFSNDQYHNFIYDKHRDLFYRLILPSFTMDEDPDYYELFNNRKKAAVMVLDSNLEYLGEYIFNDFTVHTHSNLFVGRDGLYISSNNSYNSDFEENKFKYWLLKF